MILILVLVFLLSLLMVMVIVMLPTAEEVLLYIPLPPPAELHSVYLSCTPGCSIICPSMPKTDSKFARVGVALQPVCIEDKVRPKKCSVLTSLARGTYPCLSSFIRSRLPIFSSEADSI